MKLAASDIELLKSCDLIDLTFVVGEVICIVVAYFRVVCEIKQELS